MTETIIAWEGQTSGIGAIWGRSAVLALSKQPNIHIDERDGALVAVLTTGSTALPPIVTERSEAAVKEGGQALTAYDRTWAGYAEAFLIFARYGQGDFQTCAEHDVIYSGPQTPDGMSKTDLDRLDALGWTHNEREGGFSKFT